MYYQIYKHTTAKKQVFNGIRYDSGFEAKYAQELTMRQKAGEIEKFEAHKKLALICNGYHIGDYEMDFIVYNLDGTIEYHETKGRIFPDWKWKWKILETMVDDDPNISMVLIKQGKAYKPRKIKKIAQ
jgi:hypothetical protein